MMLQEAGILHSCTACSGSADVLAPHIVKSLSFQEDKGLACGSLAQELLKFFATAIKIWTTVAVAAVLCAIMAEAVK